MIGLTTKSNQFCHCIILNRFYAVFADKEKVGHRCEGIDSRD
jgi:hypothetical protein